MNNNVCTKNSTEQDSDNYFPIFSDQKLGIRKKRLQLFKKIEEEQGIDKAYEIFNDILNKKYVILDDNYVENGLGCGLCTFMDWPESLKQKKIICGYDRIWGGVYGKKNVWDYVDKEGRCLFLKFTKSKKRYPGMGFALANMAAHVFGIGLIIFAIIYLAVDLIKHIF